MVEFVRSPSETPIREKRRIYVSSPESAPDGAVVQEDSHGYYYDTEDVGEDFSEEVRDRAREARQSEYHRSQDVSEEAREEYSPEPGEDGYEAWQFTDENEYNEKMAYDEAPDWIEDPDIRTMVDSALSRGEEEDAARMAVQYFKDTPLFQEFKQMVHSKRAAPPEQIARNFIMGELRDQPYEFSWGKNFLDKLSEVAHQIQQDRWGHMRSQDRFATSDNVVQKSNVHRFLSQKEIDRLDDILLEYGPDVVDMEDPVDEFEDELGRSFSRDERRELVSHVEQRLTEMGGDSGPGYVEHDPRDMGVPDRFDRSEKNVSARQLSHLPFERHEIEALRHQAERMTQHHEEEVVSEWERQEGVDASEHMDELVEFVRHAQEDAGSYQRSTDKLRLQEGDQVTVRDEGPVTVVEVDPSTSTAEYHGKHMGSGMSVWFNEDDWEGPVHNGMGSGRVERSKRQEGVDSPRLGERSEQDFSHLDTRELKDLREHLMNQHQAARRADDDQLMRDILHDVRAIDDVLFSRGEKSNGGEKTPTFVSSDAARKGQDYEMAYDTLVSEFDSSRVIGPILEPRRGVPPQDMDEREIREQVRDVWRYDGERDRAEQLISDYPQDVREQVLDEFEEVLMDDAIETIREQERSNTTPMGTRRWSVGFATAEDALEKETDTLYVRYEDEVPDIAEIYGRSGPHVMAETPDGMSADQLAERMYPEVARTIGYVIEWAESGPEGRAELVAEHLWQDRKTRDEIIQEAASMSPREAAERIVRGFPVDLRRDVQQEAIRQVSSYVKNELQSMTDSEIRDVNGGRTVRRSIDFATGGDADDC